MVWKQRNERHRISHCWWTVILHCIYRFQHIVLIVTDLNGLAWIGYILGKIGLGLNILTHHRLWTSYACSFSYYRPIVNSFSVFPQLQELLMCVGWLWPKLCGGLLAKTERMIEPAFPRLAALRERIQSLFYNYGLFCATHQVMLWFGFTSMLIKEK